MDVRSVAFDELALGMVVEEDVVTDQGETLRFRGEEVTRELLLQLRAGSAEAAVAADLLGGRIALVSHAGCHGR
ncbi:MAG: hypothetical protein EXR82_06555 [Gammaproteobacteria bacterium]|nr:hypothetical protein [Gammaproteobacteria bacterium]